MKKQIYIVCIHLKRGRVKLYKAIALIFVLYIAVTKVVVRIYLGSGNLKSNGWFGKREDFYYNVPSGAFHVSMDHRDVSLNGLNIGSGNGEATLSWTTGSTTAKVHAWVNGKFSGTNKVSWTLWASTWNNSD